MPLTTRCSKCGTLFGVSSEQLMARDGLVRCGVCHAIFDGWSELIDNESTHRAQAQGSVTNRLSEAENAPLPAVLRSRSSLTTPPSIDSGSSDSVDDDFDDEGDVAVAD